MGLALGCVGMSLDDFERCTPSEFRAVFDAWQQRQERDERRNWEQVRFLATASLQPYSKKTLKPTDVVTFPWDAKSSSAVTKGTSSYERMKEIEARLKRKD